MATGISLRGQITEPPNRSHRRWRNVAITLGVVAVSLGILFGDYIAAEWHARDAEREIIDLAKKIPDNATREQVAEAFAWGNYDYLKLRTHDTRAQWFFHTPGVAIARGHLETQLNTLIDRPVTSCGARRFAAHLAIEFPAVLTFLLERDVIEATTSFTSARSSRNCFGHPDPSPRSEPANDEVIQHEPLN